VALRRQRQMCIRDSNKGARALYNEFLFIILVWF
jgi:hypothetical protein